VAVKDGFIDLILNSTRVGSSKASENIKNELRKLGKINIRITTILLENGEEEYLISNLPMNKFKSNDLKEVYSLIWEIKIYDHLKNLLKIEEVRGQSKIVVEQDFFSQILFTIIIIIIIIIIDMTHKAGIIKKRKRNIR
jgi:hypothetical protein